MTEIREFWEDHERRRGFTEDGMFIGDSEHADPNELVNLAGRQEYRAKATELREQLKKLLATAGEGEPEIVDAPLYP
jgi:hypothetical protein